MQTRKITLPMWNAIEACASVLPHVSKDDVTPVITCASITRDTIAATDRFTVGQFKLAADLGEGSILLPGEAVKWIARIVTKNLLGNPNVTPYTVTIVAPDPNPYAEIQAEGEITAAARLVKVDEATKWFDQQVVLVSVESPERGQEAMRAFRPVRGNFPTIARLLDDFTPATTVPEVLLGAHHLEKFTGYARRWHRDHPMLVELSQSDKAKPGPVRISVGNFRGLVQPNLNLNN